MRRFCAFLAVLWLLGGICCFASGESVVDQADLLTAEEEATLRAEVANLKAQYGLTFALLTIDDYEPYGTLEAYADDYYDTHGYPEDGVLFVVAIEAREYYTVTSGRAISRFSDRALDQMNAAAVSALSAGQYNAAFSRYLTKAEALLAGGRASHDKPSPVLLFGSVILSLLIGLGVAFGMRARMKTVRPADSANAYIRPGSFALERSREVFLYETVTRVVIQSSNSGGTSVHRAPSGHIHGGRGGRF